MELPFFLNVVSTIAIIVGVVFGLTQLRHYHLSQMRDSALFLLNSYQTGDFSQGLWRILSIPDGLTKQEIEERVGDDVKALYLVMGAWESIGILVFHKEVTLDMVEDAYGDPITLSWQKLEPYVSAMRQEHQRETIYEWFQWLAERLKEREESGSPIPAYVAHKHWKQ
jgi:hypothetical protein